MFTDWTDMDIQIVPYERSSVMVLRRAGELGRKQGNGKRVDLIKVMLKGDRGGDGDDGDGDGD